jgi:tetratricopeptide (TPR) repeat protein
MPYIDKYTGNSFTKWEDLRPIVEKRIIETAQHGVYYAVFNPFPIAVPDGFTMSPYGILYKIEPDAILSTQDTGGSIWPLYATESLLDDFRRDFMNREVTAYFHFARGKYLFMVDQPDRGLKSIQKASKVAYDDTTIHSDIAVFLTDRGFFEQARLELGKALIYYEDLSGVHNNWGYYYHKLGDYNRAVKSYRKAIDLCPDHYGYYNNLALALYHGGKKDEAIVAFEKSLAIEGNQPSLKRFLIERDLNVVE